MNNFTQATTSIITSLIILGILISIFKYVISYALNKWLGMFSLRGRSFSAWLISVSFAILILVLALMTVTQFKTGWNIVQSSATFIGLNAYPLKNAGAAMFKTFSKTGNEAKNLVDSAKNLTKSKDQSSDIKPNNQAKKTANPEVQDRVVEKSDNQNINSSNIKQQQNIDDSVQIIIRKPVSITTTKIWLGVGLGILSFLIIYFLLHNKSTKTAFAIFIKVTNVKVLSQIHLYIILVLAMIITGSINLLSWMMISKYFVGFDVLRWSPVLVEERLETTEQTDLTNIKQLQNDQTKRQPKPKQINSAPRPSETDRSYQSKQTKQTKQPQQSQKNAEAQAAREAEEQLRIFNEQIKSQQKQRK